MLEKQSSITDNYFETEYGKHPAKLFCRTGSNSVHNPWRKHFLEFIPNGSSFLDVGCGSAADLELLLGSGKSVRYKGIDYAPTILEGARGLYPQEEFEVGCSEDIPEKDSSWNVVNCRHVIDHCEYYQNTIKELVRVAKDLIIITLWVGFSDDDLDAINKTGENCWCNRYSKTKFVEFIKTLPVDIIKLEEDHCGSNEVLIVLKKRYG